MNESAARRYRHEHGITEPGMRCPETMPNGGDRYRCADTAGHDGKHHTHIGTIVAEWRG